MRKYELYTHIHSYVHIFTHTNTDADNSCADIHACFYTYGYGCTHTKPSIHSSIHVKLEVKVKLKFSLNQATKFRMGVSSTLSLTSALDGVGGRRHAPAPFLREILGTHCIGGWLGHRAGLNGCGKSRHHPYVYINTHT